MDGVRTPVGELPGDVYWRRRLVAIAGVILLIVVVYFLIVSPGGGNEDAVVDPSATPTPTTSAAPTPDAEVTDAVACGPDDVSLSVAPTPFAFGAGSLPVFDVTIEQTGSSPCLLDTDASGTSFAVWSGTTDNRDYYFTTTHCATDPTIASRQFLLQPGDTEMFQVTWSRQRSAEGCQTLTDSPPGEGFYWAELAVQGITAEAAQFQLTS